MKKIMDKSMLGKVWKLAGGIKENNEGDQLDNLLKQILVNRGISGADAVGKFLNPSVKNSMPDPSCIQDMDKAACIIADSILKSEKIAIYGDYDVDGITATAIFIKFLGTLGADIIWHLPVREGEGYGLNNDAIKELACEGARVLITVDCGISGIKEVEFAKSLGIKVIITDHHSPDSILPAADAIVNPKRVDDNSGLSYLAGVGVAFLTLVALKRELKSRKLSEEMANKIKTTNLLDYIDLVALGTVCDTMPLVELNRAFVATGLKILKLQRNLGLKILMKVAKVAEPSVYTIGFVLGPRLNAAGRLDSAAPALELLLTDNPLIANDLANKLHFMNRERVDIQNAIMISAIDKAEKCRAKGCKSLFICGDNWHGGIMGIIAGRLKDKYNLPSCVATRINGEINGSGRSIPEVNLGKIIHNALVAGIISEGGGHAVAAGFSLSASKEKEFREFLEKEVDSQLQGRTPTQEILVDAELDSGAVTMNLVKKLNSLGPFGQGNSEPIFVLYGATLKYAVPMGNGNHLRGVVTTSKGNQLEFVGFNLVGTPVGNFLLDDTNTNTKIIMLGKLKENEYRGTGSVQFSLKDLAV